MSRISSLSNGVFYADFRSYEDVETHLVEHDAECDAVCLNDSCDGLEVVWGFEDGDRFPELVRRVGWDQRMMRATRTDPACPRIDLCPSCKSDDYESL